MRVVSRNDGRGWFLFRFWADSDRFDRNAPRRLYYFFDSSTTGSGVVRPEAMEILKDAIQHKPASMPVLTDTPREMVFYGRVCGTLRKSFEKLNADVSAVTIWYPEARKALQRLNLSLIHI